MITEYKNFIIVDYGVYCKFTTKNNYNQRISDGRLFYKAKNIEEAKAMIDYNFS